MMVSQTMPLSAPIESGFFINRRIFPLGVWIASFAGFGAFPGALEGESGGPSLGCWRTAKTKVLFTASFEH